MKLLLTTTVLSAAIASMTPLAAHAATFSFKSVLNGAQENPPVATPATGTATATLSGGPGAWVFNYVVNYSGLQGAIASPFAHIHNAEKGKNGGVVHNLDGANSAPIAGSTSGTITGDWKFNDASSPLTDALAQELLKGNLYFNIHTAFSRPGEIRGQIEPVPEPTSELGALGLIALGATWKLKNLKKKQNIAN